MIGRWEEEVIWSCLKEVNEKSTELERMKQVSGFVMILMNTQERKSQKTEVFKVGCEKKFYPFFFSWTKGLLHFQRRERRGQGKY